MRSGSCRRRGKHADGRVIGEDRFGRQDVAADGVSQGLQQGRALADPVCQHGAVQVEPLTVKDPALAIQGKMVGILADEHMGQQARSGAATLDRARRQRGLHEPLTTGAGQPGPHDPVHDEAARHIFQLFRHILADPAQAAAAVGTGICAGRQLHLHARDMIRDRTALRFVLLHDVGQLHPRGHRGGSNLAGFQGQLQLVCSLGGDAKSVRPVTGQLMAALRLCSGRSSLRSVHWTARSCFAGPFFTPDQDCL